MPKPKYNVRLGEPFFPSHLRSPDASRPYIHLAGPHRLVAWRVDQNITQLEASEKIGTDMPRYNSLENGKKRPGVNLAVRIETVTNGRVRVADWSTK